MSNETKESKLLNLEEVRNSMDKLLDIMSKGREYNSAEEFNVFTETVKEIGKDALQKFDKITKEMEDQWDQGGSSGGNESSSGDGDKGGSCIIA
jgi:hypothetical protein